MRFVILSAALALAPLVGAPALAQIAPAAAAAQGDPQARSFIEELSNDAFSVLRDPSVSRVEARTKFRRMLQENVALADIGDRLIRQSKAKFSAQQLEAYRAAFPEFILNAYADRLYDYQDATIKVTRISARGPFTDVQTRVQRAGGQPLDAIWQVKKTAAGKYLVNNLTVSNVNLSITQAADFNNRIATEGPDSLINFLKSANARSTASRSGS